MYNVRTLNGEVKSVTTTAGRLNFRIAPDAEQRLRVAAEADHQTLTDFVLGAAEARAEEILATRTVVDSDYFDRLLSALGESPTPIPKLVSAARRRRQFTQR
jgi:uncharacterized protein (DUF1778 family)